MVSEDEDVVLVGSALHTHLVSSGFKEEMEVNFEEDRASLNKHWKDGNSHDNRSDIKENASGVKGIFFLHFLKVNDIIKKLVSFIFPEISNQVKFALSKSTLDSELLVVEDEEFVRRYILSDDPPEETNREGPNFLLDTALFFAGAAVSGGVLLFDKALPLEYIALPLAFTLVIGLRTVNNLKGRRKLWKTQALVLKLLGSMKQIKTNLNKSIHVIKGMEMMNKGYMYALQTGGEEPSTLKESELCKALYKRSMFIPLRQSVYWKSVETIQALREGLQFLMSVVPLSDHIDHTDHYIGFIDLKHFGVEVDTELVEERLDVKQLKDLINLYLLQQSEYLRRLCLSFCLQIRRDKSDLSEIDIHLGDILVKLLSSGGELRSVLEYHRALGIVKEAENKSTMKELDSPAKCVGATLFSAGLHIQNCLMKVRQLEQDCDAAEIDENFLKSSNPAQILECLQGMQEIQNELKTCQECLGDGLEKIAISCKLDNKFIDKVEVPAKNDIEEATQVKVRVICEADDVNHIDEVFEAYIDKNAQNEFSCVDGVYADEKKTSMEQKQTSKVLQELKSVLVSKQEEWKIREARALTRQKGTSSCEQDKIDPVEHPEKPLNSDSELKRSKEQPRNQYHQHCPTGISFTDSSCSDSDSGLELLGKNKLFRRPLRPAATKLKSTSCSTNYRNREGVQINVQPVGFDCSLAAAAVAKCQQMKLNSNEGPGMSFGDGEECFGDADTDTDTDSVILHDIDA